MLHVSRASVVPERSQIKSCVSDPKSQAPLSVPSAAAVVVGDQIRGNDASRATPIRQLQLIGVIGAPPKASPASNSQHHLQGPRA